MTDERLFWLSCYLLVFGVAVLDPMIGAATAALVAACHLLSRKRARS